MSKKIDLENLKKEKIDSFSNYVSAFGRPPFPEWEKYLTLDYWKDWRNKISGFQTKEELFFYTERLGVLAIVIWNWRKGRIKSKKKARYLFMNRYNYWYDEKHGSMEGMSPDEIIKQEELRLQNISLTDWKKEYEPEIKFRKMSTEEMLEDPLFNEKFFGLKGESLSKNEKRREQERPDVSTFTWDEKNNLRIFTGDETNFNKFYKKTIEQFQQNVDYSVSEEEGVYTYHILSNQLKESLFFPRLEDRFDGRHDIDDIKSIRIMIEDYRDYLKREEEERDKYWKEREAYWKELNKHESKKDPNEILTYEGWTKEQLTKEVERLNTFISNLENNYESLTQDQRENRKLIIPRLKTCLNQARNSLDNIADLSNNNNEKPFPILPVIGVIGVVALLGLVAYQARKNKIKK